MLISCFKNFAHSYGTLLENTRKAISSEHLSITTFARSLELYLLTAVLSLKNACMALCIASPLLTTEIDSSSL